MILEEIKYNKGVMKVAYLNRGVEMSAKLDAQRDHEDVDAILGYATRFRDYINAVAELNVPGDDINLLVCTGLKFVEETKIGLGRGVKFYFEKYLRNYPLEVIKSETPPKYLSREMNVDYVKLPNAILSELIEFNEIVLDAVRYCMKVDEQPSLFPSNQSEALDNAG